MAATLSPTRSEITPRHSVLGFTVHTGVSGPSWFEVVMVTDPTLLDASARSKRTPGTFARSGPQYAERGEAVYLVPPTLLQRFQGKDKLYYAISVATRPDDPNPQVTRLPAAMLPYVKLAPDLATGLRRIRGYANPRGGLAGEGTYGAAAHIDGDALTWAGDHATAGAMEPAVATAPHNGHATAHPPSAAAPAVAPAHATAAAYNIPYRYNDGYPDPDALAHGHHNGATPATPIHARPPAHAQEAFTGVGTQDDDPDAHGITEPEIEDAEASEDRLASASATALQAPVQVVPPAYPGATFDAAASVNYRRGPHPPRTVDRIVIHITDGGSDYRGTVGWFKNPHQLNARGNPINVSAHYVVGQGGQIVQMVPHADIAWHASQANTRSVGIEHTARSSKPRLLPTEAEYRASACLVRWLCQQYGFPADREHIVGHHEISPRDHHDDCPTGAWDWDHYMDLVANADCTAAAAQGLEYAAPAHGLADGPSSYSINWDDVQLIGQPTEYSCWATTATMVIGWRDQRSVSVDYIASIAGRTTATGLAPGDRRQFAADVGLLAESPQSYNIEGFRELLESYGPLYVGVATPGGGGHAIVVTGMYSDGNPDGSDTYIRISDPWDRVVGTPGSPGGYLPTHATGSRYILTWDAFVREYEMRATSTGTTVDAQILHSATTFGRQPRRSGAAGYALGLADAASSDGAVHALVASQRLIGRSQEMPSIDWNLEQFAGAVSPEGDGHVATAEVFQDGPTIVLDDWPFMAAPRDHGGRRIQAACRIHWQYSGRSVGHVRVEPGALQELPGYALAVRGSVTPEHPTEAGADHQLGCLRVTLNFQFTRPDATMAHASTSLRLYGNGAYDRNGAWQ